MVRRFVADTDIFLHNNAEAVINGFADNTIIITGTVLQELDRYKTESGEVRYNSLPTPFIYSPRLC